MKSRFIHLGCIAMLAASAAAGNASRFERYPAERRQFAEQQRARASRNRNEAEAWANARGMPLRFIRNGTLYELAAIRKGKPAYLVTHNEDAGISSAANLVWENPYNLDGSGVTVGVWDGGMPLTNHIEFAGRVSYAAGQTEPLDGHASHVTGTIAAEGINRSAKGMAPAASVINYDWLYDTAEMAAKAASGPNQSGRIYLSNHSYGWVVGVENGYNWNNQEEFGQYSDSSVSTDQLVHNFEYYLPFFSSGNDAEEDSAHNNGGFETVSHYAVCKNVMTVGAVYDAVAGDGATRSENAAVYLGFSSRGPCDDGRIKPDIVANGFDLNSTSSEGWMFYQRESGTSMASPSACGSAALLVEYYKTLFGGGAMRASSLKGLIIHTADDLGNAGPDYKSGWGLMNTKAAADLLKDYAELNPSRLTESSLTFSTPAATYMYYNDGTEPLRVTVCWTDPAAADQSSVDDDRNPDLVHDLDISIEGPGGTIYYPYKLNYADPDAPASSSGKNNIDNVEQVYIAAPSPGYYSVTIDFSGAAPGDSQHYSMLASGVSSDSDSDGIPDSWELLHFGTTTGAVAGVDSDHDGADNLTEYISGYDPRDADSVFRVSSYEAAAVDGTPFVVSWESKEGRVYNVLWSGDLQYSFFSENNLSGDLPYPVNSYTDSVIRQKSIGFYRIDVKFDP